jgi:hypothetical protein
MEGEQVNMPHSSLVSVALASVLCAAVALAGGTQPLPGELYAGVAVVDITPPVGERMCGYGPSISEGVDAPLLARVLVLKTDTVSLALVSADLVWFYSDRVVTAAKAQWGLDHVILLGSHTHAGPAVDAYTQIANPQTWYVPMEDDVIAAIGEASTNLFPARLRAGAGPLESDRLAYNRREVLTNGTVRMWWTNPGREPLGPIDPTVRVIRVDDTDTGQPRVVMVHFAAHPVVFGSANRRFSPDYAGFATAHIEQALGDGVVSMFLQGGGADTHPYDCGLSGAAGSAAARTTGASLGENALRILQTMDEGPPSGPASLQVMQRVLRIGRRSNPSQLEDVGVMAVLIDDAIGFGVISGEPFVRLQLDLVAQSPITNTFLLGYGYFGLGIPLTTYLPTVQAVAEGGYGATEVAVMEAAAGERMIAQAAGMLQHLYDPVAPLIIAEPFTLSNLETGSEEFTNTNKVNVSGLPDPISIGATYNRYQITETGDAWTLDPAPSAWKPFGEPLTPESFAMPASDGPVTLYAWYTNATEAVQVQRAQGSIIYTRVAPPEPLMVETLAPYETAGYTVRVTGQALDAGSTGGLYEGDPIGIYRLEALSAATPSDDLTPDAPYVTIGAAGLYPLRLKVVNRAGNAAVAAGSVMLRVVAAAGLPTGATGDLFVALGNLRADTGGATPFRSWTTAAPTIQEAINAAPSNVTIRVAPGRYYGADNVTDPGAFDNVVSIAKAVALRGAVARERVIIDGSGLRRGLYINHARAMVEGFTITNSFRGTANGGGVYLAAGVLTNCLITGNATYGYHGGGVFAIGPGSVIAACDISGNTAGGAINFGGSGGGLRLESGASVWNSRIRFNRAPVYSGNGGGVSIGSGATLINCEISGNTAADGYMTGGVFAHGNVLLRNCLIAGNGRGRVNTSAGIGSHAHGSLNLQAVNCTIVGNQGAAIRTAFGGGNYYLTNTILYHNADTTITTDSGVMVMVACSVSSSNGMTSGSGNTTNRPEFVDVAAGNYRLKARSPCINTGANQLWMNGAFDLDGERRVRSGTVDRGAYEYFERATVISLH